MTDTMSAIRNAASAGNLAEVKRLAAEYNARAAAGEMAAVRSRRYGKLFVTKIRAEEGLGFEPCITLEGMRAPFRSTDAFTVFLASVEDEQ